MAISKEARSIAMRVCDEVAKNGAIIKSSGIDKKKWKTALREEMALREPATDKAIEAGAKEAFYDAIVDARIRFSKDASVENLRDLAAIKAALKTQNQMMQVRDEHGAYVAKMLKDCTPLELDALAEYHRQKERGHGRRAGFYERLAVQMRLAGLADDAPLSRLLAI